MVDLSSIRQYINSRRYACISKFAQRTLDLLAQSWLFLCLFGGSFVGLTYLNPVIFVNYPNWLLFNQYFLLYGAVVWASNWLANRFTDLRPAADEIEIAKKIYESESGKLDSGTAANDGGDTRTLNRTRFCVECQLIQPKRTHHCPICKLCVAVRDHHCYFAGTCVGRNNQRYFIVWTFWLAIGCIYSLFICLYYVGFHADWKSRGMNILDAAVIFMMPFRLFFGTATFFDQVVTALIHSFGVGMFIGTYLFVSQIFLAAVNRTTFEYKNSHYSWLEYTPKNRHLQRVFGTRFWPICFLVPLDFFWGKLGSRKEFEKKRP